MKYNHRWRDKDVPKYCFPRQGWEFAFCVLVIFVAYISTSYLIYLFHISPLISLSMGDHSLCRIRGEGGMIWVVNAERNPLIPIPWYLVRRHHSENLPKQRKRSRADNAIYMQLNNRSYFFPFEWDGNLIHKWNKCLKLPRKRAVWVGLLQPSSGSSEQFGSRAIFILWTCALLECRHLSVNV